MYIYIGYNIFTDVSKSLRNFKISVTIPHTSQPNIPEGLNIQQHRCDNLNSRVSKTPFFRASVQYIRRSCTQRTVMDAPPCAAASRCRLHLCDSLHTPPFMYCLKGHRHKILTQIILKHLNRRWVSHCTVVRGDRTYRVTLFVPCAEEIKCWSLHKFQKTYIARVIVVCTM